jgi:hypothetical protein
MAELDTASGRKTAGRLPWTLAKLGYHAHVLNPAAPAGQHTQLPQRLFWWAYRRSGGRQVHSSRRVMWERLLDLAELSPPHAAGELPLKACGGTAKAGGASRRRTHNGRRV